MAKKRPSPKALLAQANRVQAVEPYVSAQDLGQVLDALHRKGMTWKEVNQWCKARGYSWSVGGMVNGWKVWASKKKRK